MKFSFAVVVVMLCVSVHANAAGRLNIKLESAAENQRSTLADSGLLKLDIGNDGDQAIVISRRGLPIPASNGRLMNNMLRVVDDTGAEAAYNGFYITFKDESASDMQVKPGESHSYTIDLQSNYDLQPGKHYTVTLRFGAHFRQLSEKAGTAALAAPKTGREVEVGPVEIWIDPRKAKSSMAAPSRLSTTAAVCTAEQETAFANTKSVATSTALMGAAALGNMYHSEGDVTMFPYNARYWRWFGAHANPVPSPGDPDDNYVDQGVITVWFRVSDDQSQGPRPNVTVACGDCPQEYIDAGAVALVYPNELYVVHTCPGFYDDGTGNPPDLFPEGHPDYTSTVKTLLHEVSHFNDEHWAGTMDVEDNGTHYYSYAAVQSLASSYRPYAVRNAANYGFYFINYDSE